MMTRFVLTLLVCFLASFGASALLSDLSAKTLSCKPTSHTTKRCRLNEDWTYNFSEKLNKYGTQKLMVSCGYINSYGFYNPKKKKIRVSTCWVNKNYSCEAYFKCSEIDNTSFTNYPSIPPSEEEKLIAESLRSPEMIISERYQRYNLKNEDDVAICDAATVTGSNGAVRWRVVSIHNNPPAGYFGNSVITAKIRKLACGVNMSSLSESDICAAIDDKGVNSPFLKDINSAYFNEANARKSLDCKNPKPEISAAELAAKKKADEEARKKAAELAVKKKKEAEELAAKKKKEAEELAAKKKKEAARKKAAELAAKKKKIAERKKAEELAWKALVEAPDFYDDFVKFIKSGADKDVIKSYDLFQSKPALAPQWQEPDLNKYNKFKNTALENPDFRDFHEKRKRSRLNEIAKRRNEKVVALKTAQPMLLSILTESFGTKEADRALILQKRIEKILKSLDQQTQLDLDNAEKDVNGFIDQIEKQRLKKKSWSKVREDLVKQVKLKAIELEKFAIKRFGEPEAEKATALIKRVRRIRDQSATELRELGEEIEDLGQLLNQILAVLPVAANKPIVDAPTAPTTSEPNTIANQALPSKGQQLPKMPEGFEKVPQSQALFIEFVEKKKSQITSDMTTGKEKFFWIDASNELCQQTFLDGFPLMENWVGYVDNVIVADSGRVHFQVDIDDNGNEVQNVELDERFGRLVSGMEGSGLFGGGKGTKIMFSGYFVEGKRSENECLGTYDLDSDPKLTNRGFRFKFTDIRLFDDKKTSGSVSNDESMFKVATPKEQVKKNPDLENWFGKEFKHINLPKAVKLEDTLGFAGNIEAPYFLVFIQLESADVRAVSYEDPFTKKSEIKHYTIDCTWEVAVGNAYAKRLAIETDWNALTLTFSDDWGQQKIFSWNMATAKQTVFEPANGEDIVFSSRIAGPFSRATTLWVGGGEFKTESAAIAGAKETCVFSGVKRPTFSTINDIGFRVEGGNKKLYGPQTVLVIFLK